MKQHSWQAEPQPYSYSSVNMIAVVLLLKLFSSADQQDSVILRINSNQTTEMVLSHFSCTRIRVKCTYSKKTLSEATPEPLKFSGGLDLHIATDQHNIQNMLQEINSRAFLECSSLCQRRGGQSGWKWNFSCLILPRCYMRVSELQLG